FAWLMEIENSSLMVVFVGAVLFARLGSDSVPVTVATLVAVPAFMAVTTIVTVALAPLMRFPRLQVIVPPPLQLPWLDCAETKIVLGGNASVSFTLVAEMGPLFLTLTV